MERIVKLGIICCYLFISFACTKDEAETTGGISGLLTDRSSGEPLAAANISLNPGGKAATTGSDGRYEFASLDPGQYTIQASADGFRTNTKTVTVVAGEIVSGDMQLEEDSENFSLSVSELRFSAGNTQNSFEIVNTSISRSITWNILSNHPSWVTLSETKGVLSKGGRRAITVSMKGEPLSGSEGYITVEVAGSTKQIYVLVTKEGIKTGEIGGIVTTVTNGQALSGAKLTLTPGGKTATTESNGTYKFTGIDPGQYTVQAYCNGYQGDSKQITVKAGNTATADFQLLAETADFTLSASELEFSAGNTLKSFNIVNSSNVLPLDWKILSGYPSWISVSEKSGTLSPRGQRALSVNLISTPAKNQEGYITVEAAGSTKQVHVIFSAASSGGGEGGGGGSGDSEDYSSATISQCDSRLKAQIVSCLRLGSTVVFTCNLTNTGLGNVNDFRIYPPSSSSLINDGVRSVITDDRGNEYPGARISFRNGSASATNTANGALPESVPCKCTVTLSGVPESVKKLTLVKLGVYTYPDSQFHLANKYIDFKNVPVY